MTHLFFTGASGLLGGQLLARLLQQGRPVAVLVRSTPKASAKDRIEAVLTREEEALGRTLPRPVVIEGELTAAHCGLGAADVAWMRRACSAVLHSAASLEFIGKDRAADPWRTNVDGTRNLLALTQAAGIDEFHHVSTAYVCGLSPGPIAEAPSSGAHGFRNDYEASKHEAESLVRAASFLHEPTFYRPAVIVGDSRTGATSTYHGLMAMLQLMVVIVRNLPADETGFRKVDLRLSMTGEEKRNMIPVDWVADAIARLLADPRARGRTIHLAPDHPITIRQIIDFTSSYLNSGGVEFCGPRDIDDLNDTESAAYTGKGLYEAYEQTDPVFAMDNLRELLPDLPCPIIDEPMIHRFLAYGDADRWGKRRRQAAAVPDGRNPRVLAEATDAGMIGKPLTNSL
jgi:nucleoside-diphosphate-sugar epimerase